MSRWKRLSSERLIATTLVLFASSIGGLVGCEVIAKPDRSQIGEGGGGAGGEGGSSSSGTVCMPVDDMNDCTVDECVNNMPVNTPLASGTTCATNGGSMCDDAGACVECLVAADCGTDDACQTHSCNAGQCAVDYTAAGTPVPTQTAGDCKVAACDGNGAIIDNNDDTDLPDDSNLCTDDVCTAGVASNPPVAQGTNCGMNGNGDPLVCNDMAECVGCNSPSDCPGTDDECSQRTCNTNGVCGVTFTAKDTPVAAQTDNDCLLHVCDGNGAFVDIADDADLPLDDGNACTAEVCAAGTPGHPDVANGTACSDGDACTPMDTCQMGVCTAGTAITCTASDQCHVAGTCDPMTGMCSNPNANDGTVCNDGDLCTQTDACQAGTCTGANPVTCTASDQCHVAGSCDPMTGMCSDPTANDGTACNDNDACTQTDSCTAGTCMGSNPVSCMASDQCHVAGSCDPMTGTCSNPNAANGTMCTSNMVNGSCTMGNCVACGDGIVNGTEACDDGNTTANDGCNATCVIETGWACTGAPSACTPICGDGLIRGLEQCDDKNTTSGDGCSSACQLDISCGGGEIPVILANTTSTPIPDNYTGVISTINVTQTGVVRKVIPTIYVTHAAATHLDIFLASPFGPQRELVTDGPTGANFLATTFSDAGATLITSGVAPFIGTFRPEQTISDLAGFGNQSANGEWVLRLSDDTTPTAGTLNGWALALCVDPAVPSVCGNGIVEANEQCDDGNATTGDGCASCNLEITCGSGQTLVVQRSANSPLLIPDNNLTTGVSRSINITNTGVVAKAVTVLNAVSHAWVGDLNVTLTTPGGANVDVTSGNGSSGDNFVSTIFDDAASTAITAIVAGGNPYRGRFRPETAFSTIVGQSTNGNWTLKMADGANSDVGTTVSWTLGLCVAPTPVCGNGTVEIGEVCDDTNTMSGDGCSATCTVEAGYACTGTAPSVCTLTCGNGTVDAGEVCDDTNTMSGDGCSSTCTVVEPGYTCTGTAPSVCTFTCGNGAVSGSEQCDDGNITSNDGCTATCQWESVMEVEPNGTTAEADASPVQITATQNITGALTASDKDMFKVTVTAPDTVISFETFDSSGRDCVGMTATRITLLSSTGTQLKQDTENAGISNCSGLAVLLQPGTYYVQVDNSTGAAVPNYFLRTIFHADNGAEIEPNDSQATATSNPGSIPQIFGDHQVGTDIDWYSITVPQGASIRAEIIEGDASETCESFGIDSLITLFDAGGTQLVSDDDDARGYCSRIDGTGTSPVDTAARNLAAGTYFIKVDKSSLASATGEVFNYHLVTIVR